jgi:hypothetical protein
LPTHPNVPTHNPFADTFQPLLRNKSPSFSRE